VPLCGPLQGHPSKELPHFFLHLMSGNL
jgi:hypothetical protein